MDQSSSDISMSPSQILERLQVLRQLQLLQRGKLHKHSIQFQESNENSSNLTEMVSHFTNSPSYSTFRGLLHNSSNNVYDSSPRTNDNYLSQTVNEQDLIEGVSALNLSQESEFVVNSPISTKSTTSVLTKQYQIINNSMNRSSDASHTIKKHISLDEMPIIHPKEDFETLIQEKLKNEVIQPKNTNSNKVISDKNKSKSFLKKGEGIARFGLQKTAVVIQNTKSLPWVRKKPTNISNRSSLKNPTNIAKAEDIVIPESKGLNNNIQPTTKMQNKKIPHTQKEQAQSDIQTENLLNSKPVIEDNPLNKISQLPKGKHPLIVNKGKTWASVLTKEQNDFLKQLKQSDYYKNFASPTKSTISDVSHSENLSHLRQEQETAEQNMFELLESKVSHESFNIENSFFNRFLRRNKLECSGESTPLIMQKCLAKNPDLMHIFPELAKKNSDDLQSKIELCDNEYTDCCSDTCSSVSTCCNCKTYEEVGISNEIYMISGKNGKNNTGQKENSDKQVTTSDDKKEFIQTDTEPDENAIMKTNMAEMNAKLVATSELLKDRLRELEDEIETFRKENANLTKLREEMDIERKKFYEEKKVFEQKLNEEKILSEYYLAEEKEKLAKQKQIYEKYVREMRGRLSKRDKDEVVNLKKEIADLKDEIRLKDAKSTSTIARLRNQLKIVEKEKKDAQDEIEKLKKENRRIQHSNDVTRRMTNIKYLEQINKKLSNITSKDTKVKVNCDKDAKYRTFEIERDSKRRKVNSLAKNSRPRAKSVPNLNVTSRYAKYFSQKDSLSEFDKYKEIDDLGTNGYHSDDGDIENVLDQKNGSFGSDDIEVMQGVIEHEEDNYLEKIYTERFQHLSPKNDCSNNSNRSRGSERNSIKDNTDDFFIRQSRSDSNRNSKSPNQSSLIISQSSTVPNSVSCKSPNTVLSQRSSSSYNLDIMYNSNSQYSEEPNQSSRPSNPYNTSKSPVSILSNHISNITKSAFMNKENYDDKLIVTPEPPLSKANVKKTNMNPTEIYKPDGSKELVFPNGNKKIISADGQYSKFLYYNGDVKENFYNEGRIKYYYAETKTYHTTHADGLEVVEFPDGQVEKRYRDGSSEIRLPNGSIRYFDPKNVHIREEWRFPDGATLTVAANGEQRIVFANGQIEVHAKDHKRREFPDGTVKLVYNDGTSETRYSSGRVRIKDKHGNLIMDSAPS